MIPVSAKTPEGFPSGVDASVACCLLYKCHTRAAPYTSTISFINTNRGFAPRPPFGPTQIDR